MPAKTFLLTVLLVGVLLPGVSASAADIEIIDDGLTAGYVTLAWPEAEGDVVLERREADGWALIYEGPDGATTLTGLEDGTYEFRVTDASGSVSEPFSLTIAHHPLNRAFFFFGMGLLMFLLLVGLLIKGASDENRIEV